MEAVVAKPSPARRVEEGRSDVQTVAAAVPSDASLDRLRELRLAVQQIVGVSSPQCAVGAASPSIGDTTGTRRMPPAPVPRALPRESPAKAAVQRGGATLQVSAPDKGERAGEERIGESAYASDHDSDNESDRRSEGEGGGGEGDEAEDDVAVTNPASLASVCVVEPEKDVQPPPPIHQIPPPVPASPPQTRSEPLQTRSEPLQTRSEPGEEQSSEPRSALASACTPPDSPLAAPGVESEAESAPMESHPQPLPAPVPRADRPEADLSGALARLSIASQLRSPLRPSPSVEADKGVDLSGLSLKVPLLPSSDPYV